MARVRDLDGNYVALAATDEVTILQRTVTLTDAQIKALPTTPVEVVPAPGEGKIAYPIAGFLSIDTTEGFYENAPVTFVVVSWGDATWEALAHLETNADVPFTQGGPVYLLMSQRAGISGSDLAATEISTSVEQIVNAPLSLYVFTEDDPAEDFTGGDPANTLKVTVWYAVVDV